MTGGSTSTPTIGAVAAHVSRAEVGQVVRATAAGHDDVAYVEPLAGLDQVTTVHASHLLTTIQLRSGDLAHDASVGLVERVAVVPAHRRHRIGPDA